MRLDVHGTDSAHGPARLQGSRLGSASTGRFATTISREGGSTAARGRRTFADVRIAEVLADRLAPIVSSFETQDLELVVETAVLIAHADLTIDDAEQEALRTAMETLMNSRLAPMVVSTWIGSALQNFRACGGETYAERLGRELALRGAAEHGYRVAAVIALSSEGISAPERNYLVTLGKAAGLTEARMVELDREVLAELEA
jgi:tellurite resistance protein